MIREGDLLWQPSQSQIEQTNIVRYMQWLAAHEYGSFESYEDLWAWSVRDLPAFWESIWKFCDVDASRGYRNVLGNAHMPGAVWFEGARLNFAEHLFRHASSQRPAILWRSESEQREVSWDELSAQTAAFAIGLKNMGVGPGDRVVAVMPNVPETVIAFLAVASIGAIWSLCSPDFGAASLIDRFQQIEPVVLIAADGYRHKGKSFGRLSVVKQLREALPTLRCTVLLPYLNPEVPEGMVPWNEMLSQVGDLRFEQLPADHPLWIV
jgi:acetoacetyl-CoA synthetase